MTAAELTRADLLHDSLGAVISPCKNYRYWLHRRWSTGKGWAVFVMLNPSTADARKDDATIRACVGYAKSWGMEGIAVVNLFAWRATNPLHLSAVSEDIVGPENHAYVCLARELAGDCFMEQRNRFPGKLVCAWGANPIAAEQASTMMGWLMDGTKETSSFGKTASGAPPHPLWVRRQENIRKAPAFSSPLQFYDHRGNAV